MLIHLRSLALIPFLVAASAMLPTCGCFIDEMRISSCDKGYCSQVCGVDDLCTFSCDGGGCEQVCRAHAECVFSCDGGGCDQTCEHGSQCTVSCDGGGCEQVCESFECIFSCEQDCTEPDY
jgi:hypothetical protein